jgi:putative ABC transport system substrate-binding protein
MRRREFIGALGSAAAWPVLARAQEMPVIGLLGSESPEFDAYRVSAFRQGLGETGYVEGRNVVFEYLWAEHHFDRLPALAARLLDRRVAFFCYLPGQGTQAQTADRVVCNGHPCSGDFFYRFRGRHRCRG